MNMQPAKSPAVKQHGRFNVLGVRVDAVQIPDVISLMEQWIHRRAGGHFIAVSGMHGVMEAHHRLSFKCILKEADLVVADGMPLVWLGRWHGFRMRRRVYGPELLEAFCAQTGDRYRHFFYGGAPGVADLLAARLSERHGIRVAGCYSPPFRPLDARETAELISMVSAATPDVIWVGLSTPKQERWMWRFRSELNAPVLVGVGAAFDFHTGRVKQAPRYIRENGFEWLYRLATEPRRLWRRYLVYGSEFLLNVALEVFGIKKFT